MSLAGGEPALGLFSTRLPSLRRQAQTVRRAVPECGFNFSSGHISTPRDARVPEGCSYQKDVQDLVRSLLRTSPASDQRLYKGLGFRMKRFRSMAAYPTGYRTRTNSMPTMAMLLRV